MTPAEFFVLTYDFVASQDLCRELKLMADNQHRELSDVEKEEFRKLQNLTEMLKNELHKVDQKTEQTYYLLAKKKCMAQIKDKLGAEPV